jgi:hypothetical protein
MKYYSYNTFTYNEDGSRHDFVATLSEAQILEVYKDFWQKRMIHKFGKERFEANYKDKDCIEDWIVVNWAWETNPHDGSTLDNFLLLEEYNKLKSITDRILREFPVGNIAEHTIESIPDRISYYLKELTEYTQRVEDLEIELEELRMLYDESLNPHHKDGR